MVESDRGKVGPSGGPLFPKRPRYGIDIFDIAAWLNGETMRVESREEIDDVGENRWARRFRIVAGSSCRFESPVFGSEVVVDVESEISKGREVDDGVGDDGSWVVGPVFARVEGSNGEGNDLAERKAREDLG